MFGTLVDPFETPNFKQPVANGWKIEPTIDDGNIT